MCWLYNAFSVCQKLQLRTDFFQCVRVFSVLFRECIVFLSEPVVLFRHYNGQGETGVIFSWIWVQYNTGFRDWVSVFLLLFLLFLFYFIYLFYYACDFVWYEYRLFKLIMEMENFYYYYYSILILNLKLDLTDCSRMLLRNYLLLFELFLTFGSFIISWSQCNQIIVVKNKKISRFLQQSVLYIHIRRNKQFPSGEETTRTKLQSWLASVRNRTRNSYLPWVLLVLSFVCPFYFVLNGKETK